jgi:hypothetical protein
MKMKRTVAGMVTMGVLLFPGVAFANDKAHNEKSSNEKSSNEKTHNEKTSTDDKHDSAAASFDEIKAKCVKAITDRQASLDRAATNVLKTSDPHDGVLTTLITNSQNALAALLVEVNADTGDLAALKQDCQRIVTDNRIYALRLPQINAVMSIDRLNASLVKFGTLHDQLVAAIAAANSSSDPDAAEATATLAELEAKLASAKATLDGIDINALLAITPADYNANKNVLQPYLQAVRSAHSDVKQAAKLAKHIAKLLEPGGDTEHDG